MKHLVALLVVATVLVEPTVAQTPDWTQVTTASTPGSRLFHTMTYDSARGKSVIFGGYVEPVAFANDSWEYDGID